MSGSRKIQPIIRISRLAEDFALKKKRKKKSERFRRFSATVRTPQPVSGDRCLAVRKDEGWQKTEESRRWAWTTSRKLSSSIKLEQTWRRLAAMRTDEQSECPFSYPYGCQFLDKNEAKSSGGREKKRTGRTSGMGIRHGSESVSLWHRACSPITIFQLTLSRRENFLAAFAD